MLIHSFSNFLVIKQSNKHIRVKNKMTRNFLPLNIKVRSFRYFSLSVTSLGGGSLLSMVSFLLISSIVAPLRNLLVYTANVPPSFAQTRQVASSLQSFFFSRLPYTSIFLTFFKYFFVMFPNKLRRLF